MMAKKMLGEIMNSFMLMEREKMVAMEHYLSPSGGKPMTKAPMTKTCNWCKGLGHIERNCPSKGRKVVYGTAGSEANFDCPGCNRTHRWTN